MKLKRAGRKEPYTELGVRRMKCVRCQAKAEFQWNACADDNLWRPLCIDCDVGLNLLALTYMGDPDAPAKVAAYERKKRNEA